MRSCVLGCLAALVALCAAGSAWPRPPRTAFEDRRVVSPRGRIYAVLRDSQGGLRITIHRRRAGAAPPTPAIRRRGALAADLPSVDADPLDERLGSAELPENPTHMLVTDAPPGVVLLDTDGGRAPGRALCFVDAQGRVAWQRSLDDLGVREELQARGPTFALDWLRGLWQGASAEIHLATTGARLLAVGLADGRVRRLEELELRAQLGRLDVMAVEDRELLLELLLEHRPAMPRPAPAEAIADDATQPLGVRVRAAQLAHVLGGTRPYDTLFAQAISPAAAKEVRHAALDRIVATLGERAFDVIVASVRGAAYPADGSLHRAAGALIALQAPLLPRLEQLRATPGGDATRTVRLLAFRALRRLDTPEAREQLWDSLVTGDLVDAIECLNLLVDARPPDLRARLVAALKAGSKAKESIGYHLGVYPH